MIDPELPSIVADTSRRPEVVRAVREVYDAIAYEIAERRPRCDQSGRCCRFEEFGHRLYVTTAELAAFLAESAEGVSLPAPDATGGAGCAFQVAGLCSVHTIRPFGCRVFFCDPTAEQWQEEVYARHHAKLRRIHEALGVPYRYMEWRAALDALGWVERRARGRSLRVLRTS